MSIVKRRINNKIKVLLISVFENIEYNAFDFELLNKPIPIQSLIDKVNKKIK